MRELNGDWKDLFGLFRVSLHIPKLLLAACGLILTFLTAGAVTFYLALSGSEQNPGEFFDLLPNVNGVNDIVLTAFEFPVIATRNLLGAGSSSFEVTVLLAASFVALVAIWSFIGNAISRIAALEITRDERIEANEALAYATDQFKASFMSFFLPLIGYVIFWLVIWLVALLANIPVLNILVMAGLPLALLGGFIMVLILLGAGGGFPLFIPSIAVEGTDSFDAISRGFSYVLSRAWHYIWNWLVALVYGGICTVFVLAFACMIQTVVNEAGALAISDSMMDFGKILNVNLENTTWYTWTGGIVYYFWIFIFQTMAAGFAVSFFFCASTMIYLLMRKRVDGIDMEEVYEELDEEEELLFEEESFEEDEVEDEIKEEEGESEPAAEEEEADEEIEAEPSEEPPQEEREESADAADEDEEDEEEQAGEPETFECTEPDCDRTFDSEFGRDQHVRQAHENSNE